MHHVNTGYYYTSRRPINRMQQYAITLQNRPMYKVIKLIENHILVIKKFLAAIIFPIQVIVFDSNWLPVVRNAITCTIDYIGNFISHNKFQILRGKVIANKQAILDLDSANKFHFHIFNSISYFNLFITTSKIHLGCKKIQNSTHTPTHPKIRSKRKIS